MQKIIIEKPYKFVSPYRNTGWSTFIQRFQLFRRWLRKSEGVESYECRGTEKLRESLDAGHGILITPNHCRNADPLVMGWLARECRCHVYAMASWHLFNQDWFTSWAIRMMGAFSINREGVDRPAINTAIDILVHAERPLIIFPEGAVTRTNDRLHALLDGVAFIARTAAKRRAREVEGGKVVVHPVGLKYLYSGNIEAAADGVLTDIEHRLSWKPQRRLPLLDRVAKVGRALLCLKELEYFGEAREGTLAERLEGLVNRLLCPLEEEWLGVAGQGPVVPRVKALRMKILPEMVQGTLDAAEREHRWDQLADIYLAQQVSCYPPDYLTFPTVDRILETVERLEVDLTDAVRIHGQLKVILQIGDAIEVSPKRERGMKSDPLMTELEQRMQAMLDELAKESPIWQPPSYEAPHSSRLPHNRNGF